jgi:hypothetical protein
MDLQSLSNLFATTYNPDPNVRKAAELQIRKVRIWFWTLDHQITVTKLRESLNAQKNSHPSYVIGGQGCSHDAFCRLEKRMV